jgi:small subunit ribosomal protein S8
MNITDPIADMLTRIRNASAAKLEIVEMPHSILKGELARILKKEGYVADYVTEGGGGKKTLRVYLRYGPGASRPPIIRGLKRISKPGLRRYVPASKLPRVMGGMGMAILSTSKGILTNREARVSKIGGEVMCYVW